MRQEIDTHGPARPLASVNAGEDARYRAPALQKGLEILELLARQPFGMSLSMIAKALSRSIGEIYRVVVALEQRGYIRRVADGDSFMLTLRLFELATEHPPMNRLLSAAMPEMHRLALETEQSCHLAIISGDALLVIAQADSPRAMHYAVRTGARFPILETSSGAVFLAFDDRRANLARAMDQSPDLAAAAEQRLASIRAEGGERRESLVVSGVTNLSRPVFDHHGIVAVLTTPYLQQSGLTVDVNHADAATIACARRLSRALGSTDAQDMPSRTAA